MVLRVVEHGHRPALLWNGPAVRVVEDLLHRCLERRLPVGLDAQRQLLVDRDAAGLAGGDVHAAGARPLLLALEHRCRRFLATLFLELALKPLVTPKHPASSDQGLAVPRSSRPAIDRRVEIQWCQLSSCHSTSSKCSQPFRREVIWRSGWVSGFKAATKNWVRNHDVLLY